MHTLALLACSVILYFGLILIAFGLYLELRENP